MRKRGCSMLGAATTGAMLVSFAGVGASSAADLVVVGKGRSAPTVVVSPDAGTWEKRAGADLVKYIELMTGVSPALVTGAVPDSDGARLVLGQPALAALPELGRAIAGVLKTNPYLRTDGIALKRVGNIIYMAGNHDEAHYFAAVELLTRWGCRWYMPTGFGECIPEVDQLTVGDLDYVYSSPLEIRSYWISWRGDQAGAEEFQKRNMMTGRTGMPPTGHALGKYIQGIGKSQFNFPITKLETAQHVAGQVEELFAEGRNFSLGMEDGPYDSDYPKDQELMELQWDKYFLRWSVTDPMLELYNNVAKILRTKHPESKAKIGFLAYANMTIPPVREMKAEPALYCELAPIDIDPNHGMDDPQSPSRREFRDFMLKWAEIMDGRLGIYDYDQSMMVWRDIPNPTHMVFRQDVKHYAKAGVLGVNTESRNAIATTFLNLYFRGQLMWNPEVDVDAMLEEFYPVFYGPAADPMRDYWTAVYDAWEKTLVTEHEHFVAPAIYTPEVMAVLGKKIVEAEKLIAPLEAHRHRLTRNQTLYVDRMQFTRYSYDITRGYIDMVTAAARDCDYDKANEIGQRTLGVREKLTDMNGTFTTYRTMGVEAPDNPAWWPGEVKQYEVLAGLIDGTRGKLVAKLPLDWAFHRDPDDRGVTKGYHSKPVDLAYWNAHKDALTLDSRKDYPTDQWEMVRTDLYVHAQGIRTPERQSFTGYLWYRTSIDRAALPDPGNVALMFPGLFSECWLYINGKEVAHRDANTMWWLNSYAFEWNVDLSGKLTEPVSTIALRVNNPHHFGGIFRRPFLYQRVRH